MGLNISILGILWVHCGKTFLRCFLSRGWEPRATGPEINLADLCCVFSAS